MSGGSHVDNDGKLLVAALLVFMARGSGRIEQQEADTMIALLSEYCGISGAEALQLLRTAIDELAEQPAAGATLAERARSLSDDRKEDLAYLALRVIAADGKREAAEMARFNRAVEVAGIEPGIVHRAFDRFFAETMPETGD
jgi:uncharacterized tellurite resistance protein B-like protein